MPGAPIWVPIIVGRVGKGAMDAPAVFRCDRAVRGRPDERVREFHALADPQQPGLHRRAGGSHFEAEGLGRAVQEHRVSKGLRRGSHDDELGLGGQLMQAPHVALLDPARHRLAVEQPETAGEFYGAARVRERKQRERVSVAVCDDLIADRRVHGPRHVLQQERACVVVAQPAHLQLGDVLRSLARFAYGEHDRHLLRK